MIFVISLIILFFLVFANNLYCKDRMCNIVINIHSTWWVFLIILSALNLYSLHEVSAFTYSLIVSYILSINAGYLVGNFIFKKDSVCLEGRCIAKDLGYYANSIRLKLLLIVMIVVSSIILYKFIGIIVASSFSDAHFARLSIELFGSPLMMILYNNLIIPFSLFSMVLFCFLLIKQHYNSCFFLSFLFIGVVFCIGFGKNMILMLLLQLLCISLIVYKVNLTSLIGEYKQNFTIIKKLVVLGFLLVFITLLFSASRETDDFLTTFFNLGESINAFVNETVIYLVGPFRALDYAVHNPPFLDHLGGITYGSSSIMGADKLLDWILSSLSIEYNSAYEQVGTILQEARLSVCNEEGYFNYAFSSILYYYLDFRFIGVIIIPFVIGFILRFFIHKFNRYPSIPLFALIIFILMCCIMGFFSWELSKPGPFAYCLYLLFFHYSFIFLKSLLLKAKGYRLSSKQ
ncbi:O-antigen polymerase [Bacteroides oleiciplenus]|uniref:O-antigen polymerase n=1 Tax=Bacteroides oleiciplenus TaxID=626931 RepID=UPI0026DAC4CF|nr:O-antigen polymerase [Bacteroides oleiciplenus]